MSGSRVADQLRAPFPPSDLEWRVQRSGVKDGKVWALVIPYITARAVMTRLDEVFGIDGWEVTYRPWEQGHPGVLCTLRFRLPDGGVTSLGEPRWVTREDGAEQPETEPVKGGFSNALKRVAVTLGMGRYLYGCGDIYADVSMERQRGWLYAVHKERDGAKTPFWWRVPEKDLARLTTGEGLAGEAPPAGATTAAPAAPKPGAPAKAPEAKAPEGPSPTCPRCTGPMWDNRANKKNPRAPDWRCKDKECGGLYWPGEAPDPAQQVFAPVPPKTTESFADVPDTFTGEEDDLPF